MVSETIDTTEEKKPSSIKRIIVNIANGLMIFLSYVAVFAMGAITAVGFILLTGGKL
jgi:hypothetical protein